MCLLLCQLSIEKKAPGCLGFVGDYTTQLCGIIGIIIQFKDPVINQPGWLMERKGPPHRFFFRGFFMVEKPLKAGWILRRIGFGSTSWRAFVVEFPLMDRPNGSPEKNHTAQKNGVQNVMWKYGWKSKNRGFWYPQNGWWK